jgi:hypothetical protein
MHLLITQSMVKSDIRAKNKEPRTKNKDYKLKTTNEKRTRYIIIRS